MALIAGSPAYDITDAALLRLAASQRAASTLQRNVTRARHGRLRPGSYEFDGREAVLFRTTSVVEAFTDALLMRFLSENLEPADVLIDKLIAEVELNSSRNWDSRKAAYRRFCGVLMKDVRNFSEIEGAIDARNMIAHGLGELTARQRRDSQIHARLRRINLDAPGGRLRVSDAALQKVVQSSLNYVRSLDSVIAHAKAQR